MPSSSSPSLPTLLSIDALSALSAATLVAPLITLIDKSIILRTHTPQPIRSILLSSLRSALHHPLAFITSAPYLMINALYFSTYMTANASDTFVARQANLQAGTVSAGGTKFMATSAVNLTACVSKDAKFAKMFGAGATATTSSAVSTAAKSALKSAVPKRGVPLPTLLLFSTRDALTIFASFNIPPLLGPMIGSVAAAQFIAPASVQLMSTPLHLLGLDLYNRPSGGEKSVSRAERWKVVKRDWAGAAMARMGRIVPAFGVGGVVNSGVRRRLVERFAEGK